MKCEKEGVRLSATDLSNHLACSHLTALNLAVARGDRVAVSWSSPDTWILRERGLQHEAAYLKHLEESGLSIVDLRMIDSEEQAIQETLSAMRAGAEAIAQATMRSGRWFGRADILRRVNKPSKLGSWSYEVYDCKLARETKAATILQLSLDSDFIEHIQSILPALVYVFPPK